MIEVNADVVNGFVEPELGASQRSFAPKFAAPSCLSMAQIAVWTNRVPQHEPWPRELMVDSEFINASTDEYKKNVNHKLRLNPDDDSGAKLIGKLEGDVTTDRSPFWRR